MRRRQPAQRLSRAHARHQRWRRQPAHPQAQTRQLLPGRSARALLARGPRGDSGRVRDGDLRRVNEEAEADALAYLDFPYARHRRLRTNNVQERANRELKRRSRVAQVFPSRKALIRMLGAAFSEMDEGWAARRRFTEESIAQALAPAKPTAPAPAYEGTAEEHARRIIDVVIADNPIGRKAA